MVREGHVDGCVIHQGISYWPSQVVSAYRGDFVPHDLAEAKMPCLRPAAVASKSYCTFDGNTTYHSDFSEKPPCAEESCLAVQGKRVSPWARSFGGEGSWRAKMFETSYGKHHNGAQPVKARASSSTRAQLGLFSSKDRTKTFPQPYAGPDAFVPYEVSRRRQAELVYAQTREAALSNAKRAAAKEAATSNGETAQDLARRIRDGAERVTPRSSRSQVGGSKNGGSAPMIEGRPAPRREMVWDGVDRTRGAKSRRARPKSACLAGRGAVSRPTRPKSAQGHLPADMERLLQDDARRLERQFERGNPSGGTDDQGKDSQERPKSAGRSRPDSAARQPSHPHEDSRVERPKSASRHRPASAARHPSQPSEDSGRERPKSAGRSRPDSAVTQRGQLGEDVHCGPERPKSASRVRPYSAGRVRAGEEIPSRLERPKSASYLGDSSRTSPSEELASRGGTSSSRRPSSNRTRPEDEVAERPAHARRPASARPARPEQADDLRPSSSAAVLLSGRERENTVVCWPGSQLFAYGPSRPHPAELKQAVNAVFFGDS